MHDFSDTLTSTTPRRAGFYPFAQLQLPFWRARQRAPGRCHYQHRPAPSTRPHVLSSVRNDNHSITCCHRAANFISVILAVIIDDIVGDRSSDPLIDRYRYEKRED